MNPLQPQSPFLKKVPENQHDFLLKKVNTLLKSDKENVTTENPNINIDKMVLGENQVDGYLIQVEELIKLKRQSTRDLFKGLQKNNSPKRIVIGILGHKKLSHQKYKSIMKEKSQENKEISLFNFNILIKLRAEQSPYIGMFACDCLMAILKTRLQKNEDFKEQDIRIKWKYDFLLKDQKIGQIMLLKDSKGDDVFINVGIRLKLQNITKDESSFSRDLLQQFGTQLNVSKNLSETAAKIHKRYEQSLMYLGEDVFIRRRQPNEWEETVGGKFIRVNQAGHALLQNQDGIQEVEDGYMQRRGASGTFQQVEKLEEQRPQTIQI